MSKIINESIAVHMHDGSVPSAFIWRRRLYRVIEVLSCWREPARWWDGETVRLQVRIIATSGISTGFYELARRDKDWFLYRLLD